MDIDALEAGPELAWLVLHHALDWKLGFPAIGNAPYTRPGPAGERLEEPALPPVSSVLAEAWRLVEHVEGLGLGFALGHVPRSGRWEVRVWRDRPPQGAALASAPTPALAIARAVLKAVQASIVVKGCRAD